MRAFSNAVSPLRNLPLLVISGLFWQLLVKITGNLPLPLVYGWILTGGFLWLVVQRWYRGTGAGYPGHPDSQPAHIGTSAFGPNLNMIRDPRYLLRGIYMSYESFNLPLFLGLFMTCIFPGVGTAATVSCRERTPSS